MDLLRFIMVATPSLFLIIMIVYALVITRKPLIGRGAGAAAKERHIRFLTTFYRLGLCVITIIILCGMFVG
jgi:hypothetical protein